MTEEWSKHTDSQATEQSIKDFLAKPIILDQGIFAISDTIPVGVASRPLPAGALSVTQGAMWLEKLKGYLGIRMDLRITLKVNANRFQQGRYILLWTPLGGSHSTKDTKTLRIRGHSLTQRTTLPHVEIDLATQTSVEMLVPYTSVFNFYSLPAYTQGLNPGEFGYYSIYPYSPLVSPSGGNSCSYTVYVSMENVRLFGAASPQGLGDKELGNKLNGPISSVANSFAKGFREFANVPLLSSYALSVSWISERIAKTAAVFGYSKPIQGDGNVKMQIMNHPGHSNVDGDSDARAVSFMSKPGVLPILGLSATNEDEMDFSSISRRYAYVGEFSWTINSTGNIYNVDVHPKSQKVNIGSTVNFTPVGFLAALFCQYRGSMKFRFKIVKTEFHSGRLQFSFLPASGGASGNNFQYVNRVIVDIRETNEVELIIPFIFWKPYAGEETPGIIVVSVVDSLVAPDSVSPSVTVLIEAAGGDDIEFAIPREFPYMPQDVATFQSLDLRSVSTVIGNAVVDGDPNLYSTHVIGDKVTSFRALLKRFYPILPKDKSPTSTFRFSAPCVEVLPDGINVTGVTPAPDAVIGDLVGTVALCYTFWSGGIRVKDLVTLGPITDTLNVAGSNTVLVSTITRAGDGNENRMVYTYSPTSNRPMNNHMVLQQIFNQNGVTVEVPQYTRTLSRSVADMWLVNIGGAEDDHQDRSGTKMSVVFGYPAKFTPPSPLLDSYDAHNLFRALADDGNFLQFCSVPPMSLVVSTQNWNYS